MEKFRGGAHAMNSGANMKKKNPLKMKNECATSREMMAKYNNNTKSGMNISQDECQHKF